MPQTSKAAFAARLRAAIEFRGMEIGEIASRLKGKRGRVGVHRNTVTRHLNPLADLKPPAMTIRRDYERVLFLPDEALDQGTPAQLMARLKRGEGVAPRGIPVQAPRGLTETLAFLRAQLEGYARDGRPVPAPIVATWLGELEMATAAVPARSLVGGAGGSARAAAPPPRRTAKPR